MEMPGILGEWRRPLCQYTQAWLRSVRWESQRARSSQLPVRSKSTLWCGLVDRDGVGTYARLTEETREHAWVVQEAREAAWSSHAWLGLES